MLTHLCHLTLSDDAAGTFHGAKKHKADALGIGELCFCPYRAVFLVGFLYPGCYPGLCAMLPFQGARGLGMGSWLTPLEWMVGKFESFVVPEKFNG